MPGVRLRPERDDDREFVFELYASTREQELSVVDWSAARKAAFLRQQFEAQRLHYRQHYPGTSFDIVEIDGVPAGRLYVARWTDDIRVVDIALLPAYRGRGIGSALMAPVLAEGRDTRRPVTIHVEQFNPARRWYERMGFRRIGEVGAYYKMEWREGEARADGHAVEAGPLAERVEGSGS